jgi:hypothetical protein
MCGDDIGVRDGVPDPMMKNHIAQTSTETRALLR